MERQNGILLRQTVLRNAMQVKGLLRDMQEFIVILNLIERKGRI